MRVVVVPVLSDNYAYLIIDDASKQAACVDPAEAHIVAAKAEEEGVQIVAILTTHHHSDHAGGNTQMTQLVPGIKVYGGRLDNVEACTDFLEHDDTFNIGGIGIRALHTPGHTKGSISFYCTHETEVGGVFTGDTMFVGGCGRVFECTPEDLYNSMVNVLGKLPPNTEVFVGHEYTIKNLQFGAHVDGGNDKLKEMLQWATTQQIEKKFTVPSTMKNEWLINPFLRSGDDALKSICPGCSPVEVFAKLRQQKNNF